MSQQYYEYMLIGDLTQEYEKKVSELLTIMNSGYTVFSIHKYVDEDVTEGVKRRTVIIYSNFNITMFLYDFFKDCKLEYRVFLKKQII